MDTQSANYSAEKPDWNTPLYTVMSEIKELKAKVESSGLPSDLKEKALTQIDRILLVLKYNGSLTQLDTTQKYIDWLVNLPWETKTEDVLDINKAKEIFDKNHFGLDKIKARLLEYLSILIVQKQRLKTDVFRGPKLFFVGQAGTGKTTFAISIAESLGRKFVRIPFGGLSSSLDLRGQSKNSSPEAEPGMIIKAMRRVGSKNPVILLDELDRIAPEGKSEIMGTLLELLDPNQNKNFTDYFIDYPFDLSQVLFVATANHTENLSTAVMDRLETIQMPSYNDEEKIEIGKRYVLPQYLKQTGLTTENITIADNVWPTIVRPLGFEPGIRSLERVIEEIVRKVAYKIVKGEGTAFNINENNLREFVAL